MIRHHQFLGDNTRLGVRFRHEEVGFLRLILHFHVPGQKVRRTSFPVSSVYCPFADMISWLEALAVGAQDCTWHWEAEGPEAFIRFDRQGMVTAYQTYERCNGHGGSKHLEFWISRRALIYAFYKGFRAFAGSSEYQPARYSDRTNELLNRYPGLNPDAFIDLLLPLDAATASAILGALGEEADYDPVDDFPGDILDKMAGIFNGSLERHLEANAHRRRPILEVRHWDKLGPAARRLILKRYTNPHQQNLAAWGADLPALRSEIVEHYLSQPVESLPWRLK